MLDLITVFSAMGMQEELDTFKKDKDVGDYSGVRGVDGPGSLSGGQATALETLRAIGRGR